MNKRLYKALLITALALTFSPVFGQKKYQSLLWEVSGNGLAKPSYLYGTMHVSEKLVFQLGDPFYDAMQSVDVVALELEPENWLDDMFAEDGFSRGGSLGEDDGYDYYGGYSGGSIFSNMFVYSDEIQNNVSNILSYNPPLLNYMLFRFDSYGEGADFEENTWLDMYIYQTGKRLGKKTIGLETYQQSSWYGMLAEREERNSKVQKRYDDKDRKKLFELQSQIEQAYRRQDLDLVDSISNTTNGKAFNKYILFARNGVFVNTIDSVLKSGQSIFAGMGCAHLPGGEGVIESLRKM
ncbi:MAG: TraB/GumN family protein, partial [Flavobacteriales bacterium]